jgi:uncharacterized membrane protein/Mg-chelatase subunit ChlD
MSFLAPAGFAALLLAVPIVILHMLTPRRPATPVSSLLHWDGLKHAITSAQPWQRLRLSLLLLLQLAAVVLFALALARPASIQEAVLSDHTVFIIDASASMSAIDGSPDRLADAVARANQLREDLPEGGIASVVVASANPAVLLQHSPDADQFQRVTAAIRTSGAGADYEAAFTLAESLVLPDRPTGFVLVSDGQLDEIEQRLAPLGTRYEAVGSTDTNRAITDLSVAAVPGGLQARVTLANTGGPTSTQPLRLDVDGVTVLTEIVEIPAGQVVERVFELPEGTLVAAYLDGQDLLASDNQRYAIAPVLGELKARVHGDATFFMDQLLAAIPGVVTDVAVDEEVDFEVYVGVPVPAEPTTPFIAIDVPGGLPGLVPVGRVDNPVPTLVARSPLLEDIDISTLAIADAQRLEVENAEVLVGAPGAPLILSGDTDGVPWFYFAFTLERSNLPVSVAYPILGARMVGALAAADEVPPAITIGERVPVRAGDSVVVDPRGNRTRLSLADSAPVADVAGFWTLEGGDGATVRVAVNPDTSESRLRPATRLPELRPAPPAADGSVATIARSLLPWFLVALLAVLAFEMWVSWRTRGVPRRQWRLGLAARGLIVLLILAALFDPRIATTSNQVTTIFVLDVSASMGLSQQSARSWLQAAVAEAGSNQFAVVEFGADARVGTPIGSVLFPPARGVDQESSNPARGLRLAESLLTGETRQRIVLISDGRANAGNLQAELERLRALGLVVDVHTVSTQQRTDAAVAGIDVPSQVNEGESFTATVEVLSTISGAADVELSDSSTVLATRRVDLNPGVNRFAFEVVAGSTGLQQLKATVRMAGDAVAANDSTQTAVQVAGPPSVLIVEGDRDEGSTLEEILESTGLVVERLEVGEMGGVQELSLHQAVILVDVSARDLGEARMATLDGYVRNLGRGLVVVGGTRSYGLGGYRDTPLEALLPVDSEAVDAQREVEVAQVLLIDSSESMGACHCSEEGGFDQRPGGVLKTDIAKAGAIRAIEALGPHDEVGVLAFSGSGSWLVPLQENPDRGFVENRVGSIRPFGETKVIPSLREAAEALRSSSKELKHIILFTDGFTSELDLSPDFPMFGLSLVAEVERLAEEGITVSVVGTGEGAIPALEQVAIAGRGRFYPGRDLDEIPEIFVKEARLASRTFINEGEFFPAVTSTAPAVRDLASAPPLLGFVATTAKPTSDVQLQIGEFADPLLASWRVGLGQVTAWTSDAGDKWAATWSGWAGNPDFWSNVVRDTFPLAGAEGEVVDARISDDLLTLTLQSGEALPAGVEPVARVTLPDGTTTEVRLERRSDTEFSAVLPARQGGTYALGVSFRRPDGSEPVLSTTATRSFAAEYLPGTSDSDLMSSISAATGGRGEIEAAQAFDPEGLESGVARRSFRWWFLLAAALLWPIDVALRRLRLARGWRPDRPGSRRPLRPTPTTPSA